MREENLQDVLEIKMTFKLEDISFEGNTNMEQKLIRDYSFNKNYKLNEDRTFCLLDCRIDSPCICNMDPYGDMPTPGCSDDD